ncbi:glucan endo-1,3-beta-glucosidase 14-like [Phalaenopsis equestris]|uniref:glucan endo-1,3-beta-glucosidase 14-like n=1 Tax=Phalaenopsis equestris TaxID=78828 RepID=UPI0009E49954|nr:glucan endo-1,3-beta-glucosidase 14-like [Phalaenopsis equestris]
MEVLDRLCLSSVVYLLLLVSASLLQTTRSIGVGINYGQIANNLPSPRRVATLLKSLNINRIKLYDADQTVLSAFLNTNVEFIIGIGNENVGTMMDVNNAQAWLQQFVQPYIPNAGITCITVGNEVYSSNDTTLMANLLPAMQSVYQALVSAGLDKQISVTTAHSFNILANSYPPSSGSFRGDLSQFIQPLLNFHSMTKSPFLINAYPYFAYKDDPNSISLPYVLFEPNPGVVDPNTNLKYDNMLYAQIDSVYSAIKAMGHVGDVDVKISETGWPSKGDPDEHGASPENAAAYNGNLLRRITMNEGTPLMPSVPIDIHVFALFNENLKPGPTSERNYGLFYPDGTPVYNIGLNVGGHLSGYSNSSALIYESRDGLSFSLVVAVLTVLILYNKR